MAKSMNAQDLLQLIQDGASIDRLPSALEVAINSLRDDLAADAVRRSEEISRLALSFEKAIDKISTREDIDIEGLLKGFAQVVLQSQQKPSYEFNVERNNYGQLKKITANPKSLN